MNKYKVVQKCFLFFSIVSIKFRCFNFCVLSNNCLREFEVIIKHHIPVNYYFMQFRSYLASIPMLYDAPTNEKKYILIILYHCT